MQSHSIKMYFRLLGSENSDRLTLSVGNFVNIVNYNEISKPPDNADEIFASRGATTAKDLLRLNVKIQALRLNFDASIIDLATQYIWGYRLKSLQKERFRNQARSIMITQIAPQAPSDPQENAFFNGISFSC